MNQILELSNKDFKAAVIRNALISNYKFSKNNRKMENISKDIKIEIVKLKNIITKIKTYLMGSIVQWK